MFAQLIWLTLVLSKEVSSDVELFFDLFEPVNKEEQIGFWYAKIQSFHVLKALCNFISYLFPFILWPLIFSFINYFLTNKIVMYVPESLVQNPLSSWRHILSVVHAKLIYYAVFYMENLNYNWPVTDCFW